ncbi:AAA family ATPase, partial [Candidatus Woesearchaeota archaeon]|nr:AAA family ATPase [Candidatus Woesearchaeota archaeon]
NKSFDIEKEANQVKADIEKIREKLEQQKQIIEKIKPFDDLIAQERESAIKLSELEGKKEALQKIIQQASKKLENLDEEIQELDQEHSELVEEKSLYEYKDKHVSLKKELIEIDEKILSNKVSPEQANKLEEQFQELISKTQALKSKSESLTAICSEKEKRLADLKQKQTKTAELKQSIEKLQKRIEFLNQFKNALLIAQSSLRKELVQAVNEVMNSVWNALYPYDKWDSIRLDATEIDYTLQIRDADGNWLNVSGFASGGERMLACLALRIAFAKVLAPNLSMLILDEPTHNLDYAAISKLIEVIQEKLSDTLEQVFIVTHDEKLAEAGQNIIRIN